jgi:aldehyde:ferredoxin oxidoreductase
MYGYSGKILKVDLSGQRIGTLETADYADRFLGGRGIATKLYWDMVSPRVKAFDPENCLICASGPVAGFSGFAGNRWLVCGKSPNGEPEAFSYGNLGGGWGNRLKYAGFDGIVVQGTADRPVYLFIHNGEVEIRDASHIWGRSSFDASDSLKTELGKSTSILTIGQAAENRVYFATLWADEGASGSGGMGAIMGSKKLKAIAVAGDRKPIAADPERLQTLAKRPELSRGPIPPMPWVIPSRTVPQICSGCGIGCTRQSYKDETGRRFKSLCQPIDIYRRQSSKYYNGWNEAVLLATRLCDQYGLDSCVMQAMIEWLTLCYRDGLITEENTGLPLSRTGSQEYIQTLTRMIALREGFGDILAQGTIKAAESIGGRAREFISYTVTNRTNEAKDYEPRLILHSALIFATEPRRSIQQLHEPSSFLLAWLEKKDKSNPEIFQQTAQIYWGNAEAADYSSYQGKALAAKKIQDRTHSLESLVLCNFRWPGILSGIMANKVGDLTLPSQILSAVTGRELDKDALDEIGNRIFNIQRAVMLKQGWGGKAGDSLLDYHHNEPLQFSRLDRDCLVPGKNGGVASRKGEVVDRKEFEKMRDEYYALRGWDIESGLPTHAGLKKLNLEDIADGLEKLGRLKP